MTRAQGSGGVPVIKIVKDESSIKFNVKASVALEGTFDKWDAKITMTSADVESGVLDIGIQAANVDTGSGMKEGKLKSNDFFDVEQNPLITFTRRRRDRPVRTRSITSAISQSAE
jgi:polyisoprenoid-binding protein YceI